MTDISIIGMACIYPDANSPEELWQNILSGRKAFRKIPEVRLNNADYISQNGSQDTTYSPRAALIEGYEFDREQFKVVGSTFRSTDLTHWLALDVASQALEDAGFPEAEGLPRETTGVLIGNSLTGEFSRAGVMRLRWPFVKRVVARQLQEEEWPEDKLQAFLNILEQNYKAPFPETGDETLAGGLSNTIAGRICNHFDLGGGGYTIDGACSSSLLSVANSCSALANGDLDLAIAGGVDLSLDPFELVGFSRLGALAAGEMRLFDLNPTGFLPGEGCGLLVLMRRSDAEKKHLRRYADIRGFGISSDGGGGLTRPEIEGQKRAIVRAYRKAGYGPDTLALFEAHGTGTAIGDEVELSALQSLLEAAKSVEPIAIGSIKANIGHTKAAAGVAGLIKAGLALHHKVIPPTTGIVNVKHILADDSSRLRVLKQAEAWPANKKLRAGVSAFGFGGINAHITLEKPLSDHALSIPAAGLPRPPQDAELFLFGGTSKVKLRKKLKKILSISPVLSFGELTDLSAALHREFSSGAYSAAVVAGTPEELTRRLRMLLKLKIDDQTITLDAEKGIFFAKAVAGAKVAFLFPGQASPVRLESGLLGSRFPGIKQSYEAADLSKYSDRSSTATAQPAIITAELAGLALMEQLGIRAETAVGHSLGELTCLCWSGILDPDTTLKLAEIRGRLMEELAVPGGAMASVAATAEVIAPLLSEDAGKTVISCYNSPKRVVVSGDINHVKIFVKKLRSRKIGASLLPVNQAFHSGLMQSVIPEMETYLKKIKFSSSKRTFISTITGGPLGRTDEPAKLLVEQLTKPVRFVEAMRHVPEEIAWCIEMGPGAVLTGLTSGWLSKPVISLDVGGQSIRGLLNVVAAACVTGMPVKTDYLFEGRFYKTFNPDHNFHFFENPCEKAPALSAKMQSSNTPGRQADVSEKKQPSQVTGEETTTLELVLQLVAEKTELPVSALDPHSNLLRDLHLNSISVSQLVAKAAGLLGMEPITSPLDYATASSAEIAKALDEVRSSNRSSKQQKEELPAGIGNWVRPFRIKLVETRPPDSAKPAAARGSWELMSRPGDNFATLLKPHLKNLSGNGILLSLPAGPRETHLKLLLKSAKKVAELDGEKKFFVLVQPGRAAAAFFRTFQHEFPEIITCILDLPPKPESVTLLGSEINAASGFTEVVYERNGRRFERRLELMQPEPKDFPLTTGDVLLVTGGGKGISAECALDLAKRNGIKLALLGRSPVGSDSELQRNLERFEAAEIDFLYLSCDITQPDSVLKTSREIQSKLGDIKGILHGAGINRPRLLGNLTETEFKKTLAPKVTGFKNLLQSIDASKLKLLVTFGSIIAETGMTGEADYGLANDYLAHETERFARAHPNCHCMVTEWSIWSGAGMGERLGRVETLLKRGIFPITPDKGIQIFRELVSCRLNEPRIVISARMGNIPFIPTDKPELPFMRFLDQPQVYYPGIELITEAELSPATDLYLDDHVYKGERLFPGVMGLEAMLQCAMALQNTQTVPSVRKIEFLRPVIIPENEKIRLRLIALAHQDGRVEVAVRSDQTDFQADHFRAVCHFNEIVGRRAILKDLVLPEAALKLDAQKELYGSLFFQSGRLMKLQDYNWLHARSCSALISPADNENWYARYLPQTMLAGDHGSQDAALHALQVCTPHLQLLPVAVETWLPGKLSGSGPWTVRAEEREHDGDNFTYDLELLNADGSLREQWLGLRLKKVSEIDWHKWPPALLPAYLERKLEEFFGDDQIKLLLNADKTDKDRPTTDALFRQITGSRDGIFHRSDGKPETAGEVTLSAAKNRGFVLAAAHLSGSPLACDMESIVPRSEGNWQQLIGAEGLTLAQQITKQNEDSGDSAGTRVWTAIECLKKTGALAKTPIVIEKILADGWVLLKAGSARIATCKISLKTAKLPVIIAILMEP